LKQEYWFIRIVC